MDVLSFPLDEYLARKYGILALGDIVICPAKATGREEYDHEHSPRDHKKMKAIQEKIVALCLSR